MVDLVAETNAASDILLSLHLPKTMPEWAVDVLKHAYGHLYAAMAFDFVRKAETEIIGVDGVRMDDGSVKTSRRFLAENVVDKMLDQIDQKDRGREFTAIIRRKFNRLLELDGK